MFRNLLSRSKNLLPLIILLFCFVAGTSDAFADSLDFVPGEVVVKLAHTTDLPGVAAQFNLAPVPLSQFGSRSIYRLKILDGTAVDQKVSQLLA
ncbi:MAG: hypothetical protein M3362_24920, partial [Acidobacteriota bacterium]|nr:hypothetical protein [Acidobacteriota bacterium]